jgi:hypothetical protein
MSRREIEQRISRIQAMRLTARVARRSSPGSVCLEPWVVLPTDRQQIGRSVMCLRRVPHGQAETWPVYGRPVFCITPAAAAGETHVIALTATCRLR